MTAAAYLQSLELTLSTMHKFVKLVKYGNQPLAGLFCRCAR